MDQRGEDGATRRAHLEAAATKGSQTAINALEPPSYPSALGYLLEWAYALFGRSGVGMSGLAPLGYGTIESWARLRGEDPTPMEVVALMELDGVFRDPDADVDGTDDVEQDEMARTPDEIREQYAWPERKS